MNEDCGYFCATYLPLDDGLWAITDVKYTIKLDVCDFIDVSHLAVLPDPDHTYLGGQI